MGQILLDVELLFRPFSLFQSGLILLAVVAYFALCSVSVFYVFEQHGVFWRFSGLAVETKPVVLFILVYALFWGELEYML